MFARLSIVTTLILLTATPALAERQTYSPGTTGVTYYQLQREMARRDRQKVLGVSDQRRVSRSRYISPEEERQVLSIDKQMKQRFPIHPGLYRDAYDRGTWRRSTGPGNNPGDN